MKSYMIDKQYIIDSRSLVDPDNTIFVALRTAVGDGHKYIETLYEKGVRQFIVEKGVPDLLSGKYNDALIIDVADTLQYLSNEAKKKLNDFGKPVVAVTGSRGKTIVKEWIALLMNGKAVRSPRSYNSLIGVPLSIMNGALSYGECYIQEVGISQRGEMLIHSQTVDPDIVIITNVTNEHSEGFLSRYDQIKEKLELARNAKYLIFNSGDELLADYIKNELPRINPEIYIIECFPNENNVHFIITQNNVEVGNETIEYFDNIIAKKYHNDFRFYKENLALSLVTKQVLSEFYSITTKPINATLRDLPTKLSWSEGYNNSVVLVDNFTSDVLSLQQSFDKTRRISHNKRFTLLIYNPVDTENHIDPIQLEQIFKEALKYNFDDVILFDKNFSRSENYISPSINVVRDIRELSDILPPENLNNDVILIHTPQKDDDFKEILSHYEVRQHETSLEINIDSLIHNYKYFKSKIDRNTGIICMLKAFGYGTGSVEIARALELQGVEAIAVAVVDEGIELRNNGIKTHVMVLNPRAHHFDSIREYNLEPVIYNFQLLEDFVRFLKLNNIQHQGIHIKLETGMRRVGFTHSELPALVDCLLQNQNHLKVKTVFSHLATADCLDMDDYTIGQINTFETMTACLSKQLPYEFKRHLLNTAGILRFPSAQMDMVRLGIGLYGVNTLPSTIENGLKPVASLFTTVISLKQWKKGDSVGYSRKGILDHDAVIATLPIGYADGIDRRLGNGNMRMIIEGIECPTVGNICMDLCMIDVTDVKDCHVGTRVEVFGENNSINDIAECLDTIPYEILTSVSKRVNRQYFRE